MKYLYFKDENNRNFFNTIEKEKARLNFIFSNVFLPINFRFKIYTNSHFNSPIFNASKSKLRNRCIVTNRSRSVFSFFKISRLEFRRRSSKGMLTHVQKSTW